MGVSKRAKLIVAIDGPSGAGKSTAAKSLAKRLGYTYIDTGAMYRAVAVRARKLSGGLEDPEALSALISSLRITFSELDGEPRILCDGQDVTDIIRSPEISLLASEISKNRMVRETLVRLQREMGSQGGVVLEGRDIGTVVFPEADVKFYLDAHPQERALRRYNELRERGVGVNFDEVMKEVAQRDENDMNRALSPLRKPEDAEVIDSTHLSVEEVVERMVRQVGKEAT